MIRWKPLATRTRLEGLVIFMFAAGYLWQANQVPEFLQMPGVPGPTTFPRLLGVVFGLTGLWLLISPKEILASRRQLPTERKENLCAPDERLPISHLMKASWHFLAMWVLILGYLWAMPDLGFPPTTFLLLGLFFRLLGETRLHVVIGLALAATVLIFVSFKIGLNVRLPLGVLEPWFK